MLVSIALLDYQRVSETKHDAIVIGEHSRKNDVLVLLVSTCLEYWLSSAIFGMMLPVDEHIVHVH